MLTRMNAAKFNHLSFPSTNVQATVDFFVKYAGCTLSAQGTVPGTQHEWAVLKRGEFDIVIESPDRPMSWPFAFHLGLEVDSVAEVHTLHTQFVANGVEMVIGYQGSTGVVFNNTRGSRFFCRAPGGVMFEIHTREDIHDQWKGSFDSQREAERPGKSG